MACSTAGIWQVSCFDGLFGAVPCRLKFGLRNHVLKTDEAPVMPSVFMSEAWEVGVCLGETPEGEGYLSGSQHIAYMGVGELAPDAHLAAGTWSLRRAMRGHGGSRSRCWWRAAWMTRWKSAASSWSLRVL